MDNNNDIKNQSENKDNSQEIFNLIQSIQSKLDTNNKNEDNENKQVEFEETKKYTKEKNIDNNFNLSNINSILQNVDLNSIIHLLGNSSKEKENNSNNNSGFN